jgi:transposase-like protein
MSKHNENVHLPVVNYSPETEECDMIHASVVKSIGDVAKPEEAELRATQGPSGRGRKRNRFNSPGQGRKLTYSEDTDRSIASHIKEKLENNDKVTIQYICSFAKQVICQENPTFVASSGWAHRFLARHGIVLQNIPKYKIRSVKSGQVIDYKGRPLSYSPDTDLQIAEFVREQQSAGVVVSNSSLRNHARSIIQKENPNFTASASWAQNFLLRHRLSLNVPSATSSAPIVKDSSMTSGTELTSTKIKETTSDQLGASVTVRAAISQAPTTVNSMTSYSLLHTFADVTEYPHNTPKDASEGKVSSVNQESEVMATNSIQSTPLMLSNSEQPLNSQANQIFAPDGFVQSEGGLGQSSSAFSLPQGHRPFPAWSSTSSTPLPTLSLEGDDKSSPARCRPLSYPRETDQAVAEWVRKQQEAGERVTFSKLRKYAKDLIQNENPTFNASVGWVTPFLLRHNLDLSVNKKKNLSLDKCQRRIPSCFPCGPTSSDFDAFSQKSTSKVRHTLEEKYDVVKIIKDYGLSLQQSSRILGIAVSTLSGWVKMASTKQESSEQPVAGNKAHEDAIVQWVWSQIQQGQTFGPDHALAYAQSIANCEDALIDDRYRWIQDVFDRHGIQLQHGTSIPSKDMSSVDTSQQSESSYNFSPEVEGYITTWIRQKVMESGKLSIVQLTRFIQLLLQENSLSSSVSLGWLFRFLIKNNLQLDPKPPVSDGIPPEFSSIQSKPDIPDTPTSSDLSFVGNFQMLKTHGRVEGSAEAGVESSFTTSHKQASSTISSDVLLSLSCVSQASPPRSTSPPTLLVKPAREFTKLEKEEVVKYANTTTLQKAAMKYGIAAPTVWRWRIELKMNSPRFSLEQKKSILSYTEENGAKNASRKFGISTRTIHNWRKIHSPEGALSKVTDKEFSYRNSLDGDEDILRDRSELADACSQPFEFIMLSDRTSLSSSASSAPTSLSQAPPSSRECKPMEVVMMPEDCGVEYDVGSTEEVQGCYTVRWRPEEKLEILKYAHIHSPKVASERFGVKLSTLQQWMKRFGVPDISPADVSVYLNASFRPIGGNGTSSRQEKEPDAFCELESSSKTVDSKFVSHCLSSSDGDSEVVASPSDLLAPVDVRQLAQSPGTENS